MSLRDTEERRTVTQLLDRIGAGDDLAFAQLYDGYAATVYGLALRVTRDRSAAEDITQEVFLRVWERPDSYDPARGELRPWLATVARRRSVDWLRRSTTYRRHTTALAREPVEHVEHVEDAVVRGEVAAVVRDAVERLPETNRSAILLAYYRGLTYRGVAEALGIPEGTAKSRLRAGLQRLAQELTDAGLVET
jgi:RNA polymerase sigma factor (sigma-70 family)